jgi:hypothetical protein
MINFTTDLDVATGAHQSGRHIAASTVVPVVTESLTIRRHSNPDQRRSYVGRPDDQWTWQNMRDYVMSQMEARFGQIDRNPMKERGIFLGFLNRWGAQAPRIARFALETCEGIWQGNRIDINRFCKKSDPWFAAQIAQRLQ